MGIEPTLAAWEAAVLPLNYTRADDRSLCRAGGQGNAAPATGGLDTPVPGNWGSVVVRPDGSYAYTVDPTQPAVIALRPGETLTDTFTYTVRDPGGQWATGTLTITVEGRNDPPVATDTLTRMDLQPPRTGPMPAVVPHGSQ